MKAHMKYDKNYTFLAKKMLQTEVQKRSTRGSSLTLKDPDTAPNRKKGRMRKMPPRQVKFESLVLFSPI